MSRGWYRGGWKPNRRPVRLPSLASSMPLGSGGPAQLFWQPNTQAGAFRGDDGAGR